MGCSWYETSAVSPKSWPDVPAGVPDRTSELAQVLELGYLRAEWVAGDDAFGMSPTFREGLAALGMRYVLDVPGGTTVWPWTRLGPVRNIRGSAAPANPSCGLGSGGPWSSAVMNPDEAWREITVAQGSQGPRTYRFPSGCGPPGGASPARKPSGAGTWTAASPVTTCPNAPEGTTLETLAYVGSRWRIETEFELRRVTGRIRDPQLHHSHVPAGWNSRIGGKKMPRNNRCTGWCGRCCPGSSSGPINCCCGWRIRSYATSVPTRRLHPPRKQDGAATLNPSL